jgi:hypothetical protein
MEDNRQTDEEFFNEPLDLPGEPDTDDWSSSMPKRSWKRPAIIAVIVILLIVGGFFAWSVFGADTNQEETDATQAESEAAGDTTEESATTVAGGDDVPPVGDTETVRTSNPRMEVTHPTSWTLAEGEDDVSIQSPAFQLTTSDGTQIDNASFKLYLRQGAREIDSTYIGQGVAAISSETLTYSNPALGQREDTNVSFFGNGTTNHISYLFVAGNFSLSPNDTLGPDFGQDPDTYIIAGGYTSPALEDDLAMHPISVSEFQDTNAYSQALDIIRSLSLL